MNKPTNEENVEEKKPTSYAIFKDRTEKLRRDLISAEKLAKVVSKLPSGYVGYKVQDDTVVTRKMVTAIFTEIRKEIKGLNRIYKDGITEAIKAKKKQRGSRRNPLYDPLDIGPELRAFFEDKTVNLGYATPGDKTTTSLAEALPNFFDHGYTNRIQIAFLFQIHCLLEGTFDDKSPGGLCKSTPQMKTHFRKIYDKIYTDQQTNPKKKPFDENAISYINLQVLIAYLTKSNTELTKEQKEEIREVMMPENNLVKVNTKIYKSNIELRIKY